MEMIKLIQRTLIGMGTVWIILALCTTLFTKGTNYSFLSNSVVCVVGSLVVGAIRQSKEI